MLICKDEIFLNPEAYILFGSFRNSVPGTYKTFHRREGNLLE